MLLLTLSLGTSYAREVNITCDPLGYNEAPIVFVIDTDTREVFEPADQGQLKIPYTGVHWSDNFISFSRHWSDSDGSFVFSYVFAPYNRTLYEYYIDETGATDSLTWRCR